MDQIIHGSAVDALVRASRSAGNRNDSSSAISQRSHVDRPARYVDPHFEALLLRLLAGTADPTIPCIQFVACDDQNHAATIAFRIAQAATSILGRTLLVNAHMKGHCANSINCGHSSIPDAFIPALYHHDMTSDPGNTDLLFGAAQRTSFHALISPYKFVAIDCSAPSRSPAATALAAFCLGSVLVVTAGVTTREAVRDTSLTVTNAGGKVIGTVLADAPSNLPAWINGR